MSLLEGTNFYTQSSGNQHVWVKFTQETGLIDDCELRGTTTLPTETDLFSQGCTLKIKSTGDRYINTAADGLAPTWSAGVLSATVPISSAQLLALFSSPVQLVAAPGTNKFLVVDKIVIRYNHGLTSYTQPGNTNATIGSNNTCQFGTFFAGASSAVIQSSPTSIILTDNTALLLKNTTGNMTNGDGDAIVYVYYDIKTF